MLITYDENDRFLDHVVPAYPTAGNSTVDLRDEFRPAGAPAGEGDMTPAYVSPGLSQP